MEPYDFAHLHLHTDASLRDGLGTVENMVLTAKHIGFKQMAMTDHGTLANAVSFAIATKAAGIKPIFGLEGYIEFDGVIGHITLLADGSVGWNSLLKLNNMAHLSEYKQPAFRIDDLIANQNGLLCMTGCVASPFHQLSFEDAYRLGVRLKSAFGYRLFAEMMFVGDSIAWERPLKLSERLGIKTVITNDVHFPKQTDGAIHPILTKMKSGFDYNSKDLWLKPPDAIIEKATRFYEINEGTVIDALNRSGKIARKIKTVELKATPVLPTVGSPKSSKNKIMKIANSSGRLAPSWVVSKKDYIDKVYADRLDYEIEIISSMGYLDYFLILLDIISEAKRMGVKVGPGRGSGVGSLVLYALGITDVDPIEYGLSFERFLNPLREGMPDVDIDIDSQNRDKVLEYASRKYNAVPIATYSKYSHKSLVRDLGKMFRVDKEVIDKAADEGINSDAFSSMAKENELFAACYDRFLGQIRHKGKHAGGIIITNTKVPKERIGKTIGAAWAEGVNRELSYAGIVKFDLLGLSVLSALKNLEDSFGISPPKPVPGAKEFSLFKTGDLSGIFQFAGSAGIRKLTMKLKPDNIKDLIAINALYRPGAIDAGSMEKYPEWKEKPRKVAPYISHVLEETYGAIIYQEQVMSIYALTINGSMGDADIARRIITKSKVGDPKWEEKILEIKGKFIDGAIANHALTLKEANELWSELETHSRYSFNKAHSTAYSMIAWQCAWWKYNYPAAFFAEMLNTDPQNGQTYIVDAVSFGLTIVPPHVNVSGVGWVGDRSKIHMPLNSIKYLGVSGAKAIVEARDDTKDGKFETIDQFMKLVPKRLVKARAREGLLYLKGFNDIDTIDFSKIYEKLSIKSPTSLVKPSKRDVQLKYLGLIIPTSSMLEKFTRLEKIGFTCGIIKKSEIRTSKFGAYCVYYLSPNGVFWSRDVMDLPNGSVVGVRISKKNGRAERIKII